jgi:NADPH:quinone reductase-like Zn-dependent oxidoreductase
VACPRQDGGGFADRCRRAAQLGRGGAPGALDETIALLADGRLRLRAHASMPMQQAAEAHRQLEGGHVHERIILTLQ